MMNARRALADRERLGMKCSWRYFRRQLLGHSQRRVARLCGIGRGTVARWESAQSRELPDIGDIVALAGAMRVEPVELFRWILTARGCTGERTL